MRVRRMLGALLSGVALLAASAVARTAHAQLSASAHATYSGTIDYTIAGATLRPNSDQANACAMTSNGSAVLSGVPAGATIVAAWLYWAGSGPADNAIRFQSTDIIASRTWTTNLSTPSGTLSFFGGARDVTPMVTGNGTYSVSQLAVTNNGAYCDLQLVLAGWGVIVVYSSPSLPLRTVQLRDGFGALQNGTSTSSLTGFGPGAAARVSLLTWEGDAGTTGSAGAPEEVRVNGTTVSTPPNNAFNSTISSLGTSNSWGMDFDSYDVTALQRDDGTATVEISTGADLIFPQLLVTAVDVGLVDVTPKGLGAPVVRLGGAKYAQQFLVENRAATTESYDLVARLAGVSFLTIDSVTGPGAIGLRTRADSLRVSIAGRASASFQVWYTVAAGAPADAVLYLLARSVRLPTASYARSEGWQELRRGAASLTLAKSVSPNTNVTPGIDLTYTMTVTNAGNATAQGLVVRDDVPSPLAFKIGSVTQTLPAGITATAEYSNDGGATWTYVPAAAGCGAPAGYDRCVNAVRWRLSGPLAGGGAATASLVYLARVP